MASLLQGQNTRKSSRRKRCRPTREVHGPLQGPQGPWWQCFGSHRGPRRWWQTSWLCVRIMPGSGRPGQGPRQPPDAHWTWAQYLTFNSLGRTMTLFSASSPVSDKFPKWLQNVTEKRGKQPGSKRLLTSTSVCPGSGRLGFHWDTMLLTPGAPTGQ